MDTTHTTIDGVRLEVAYIPGPVYRAPLLFLHEGLGSVAMWPQRSRDWPAELCAATGRAGVLYSRRGYGQSDPIPQVRGSHRTDAPASALWPHGRHTPRYMHHEAEAVLPRLRSALGLQQVVLVGHSDGATIALLHAASQPCDAVVVMAPHLFVEPMTLAAIEQARDAYSDAGAQGLRAKLARFHADVDNAFWQWKDIWLDPAFASSDIAQECARIPCPVLAVQVVQDAYGTLAQLERLQHAASQTQTLALDACGHSPHRDQPDALTTAVRDFLQTVTD